jgi:hypothetical protein
MPDVEKILNVVNQTDQTIGATVGSSQAMLKNSIRKLERDIMVAYQGLTVGDGGNLIGPRVNLKQSQKIHKKIVNLFEEQYGTGARRAVKGYATVDAAIMKEFKAFDIAADFTSIDKDMLTALKEQAYTEYVQFGTAAQERIAQTMYDTVAGGGSFSELMKTTTGILLGGKDARGRSLSAYATQWANDGVMNYHQSVTLKKAKDASLVTFLYYGDIITTSRQFCIDRVGKVFSKKQIESWDGMVWSGKSGPALTYRGGYNCRHHWHPIKKDWVPDGEIPIQDIYAEQGVVMPRGNTIPVWPTKGGTLSKKKVPTGAKAKVYKDPYDRWVPLDINEAGAIEWSDNVLSAGAEFAELEALGPCGPVADNIVQVLRGRGKDARVMYTGFDDGVNSFPHYVAVEVNKAGDVVKIWDPTNPFIDAKKRILRVKAGAKPKNYFQAADSDYGEAEIFNIGDYAHTDGSIYGPDEFKWFTGKLKRPPGATKALKGMPAPGPKKRPKFVPAKNLDEAEAFTAKLTKEGNQDAWPTIEENGKEVPFQRFQHEGTSVAFSKTKSFTYKERAVIYETDYHTADFKRIDVRAANVMNEHLMVLQDRSINLGIPRLRGVWVQQISTGAAASMGDGVLMIDNISSSRYWRKLAPSEIDWRIDQIKGLIRRMEDDLPNITKIEATELKKYIKEKKQLLKDTQAGRIRQDTYDWKPGNSKKSRPHVGNRYYQYTDDAFRHTLNHEYGHHIHQMLFVENRWQMDSPWLEHWLYSLKSKSKDLGMVTPTKYAEKNSKEWFAENYALWKGGKKHLVNKELKPLLDGLDQVEDGKLTTKQLRDSIEDPYEYDELVEGW